MKIEVTENESDVVSPRTMELGVLYKTVGTKLYCMVVRHYGTTENQIVFFESENGTNSVCVRSFNNADQTIVGKGVVKVKGKRVQLTFDC